MTDKTLEMQEELHTIKAQLDMLGVKYHHNAKLETLQNLLKDTLETKESAKAPTATARKSVREEILKPVLVKINCVNPRKSSWRGEYFYFGNSVVGRCKDFVPYNTGEDPEPVWLPKMLVEVLKERRFLSTFELKRSEVGADGVGHRTGWKPEFIIEVVKEG